MTIELGQNAFAALNLLRDQAKVREITLDTYLQRLAESGGNGVVNTQLSVAELERYLDDLAAGPSLTPLPGDFSQADIYAEHD